MQTRNAAVFWFGVVVCAFASPARPQASQPASAELSVEQWIARYDAESRRAFNLARLSNTDELMLALPSPANWKALVTAIDARPIANDDDHLQRRELALHALGHVLINDGDWLRSHADGLDQFSDPNNGPLNQKPLSQILAGEEPPEPSSLEFFKLALSGQVFTNTLTVPGLYGLVEEKQIEQMLREALAKPVALTVPSGDRTRAMAQKLALELVNELKVPQWGLVSPESPELYEALWKRFVDNPPLDFDPKQYEHQFFEASVMHGWGFLLRGDLEGEQAQTPRWTKIPQFPITELSSRGDAVRLQVMHSAKAYETLYKFLSDKPDSGFWQLFRETAIHSGHVPEMVELAKRSVGNPKLTRVTVRNIRMNIAEALLAIDQVDEGISTLRLLQGDPNYGAEASISVAMQLAQIGQLTGRPELVRDMIGRAWQVYNLNAAKLDRSARNSKFDLIVETMIATGQGPEALGPLTDEIKRLKEGGDQSDMYRIRQLLVATVHIHHDAGQYREIIDLLTQSPDWQASDLSQILTQRLESRAPLGLMAASALFHTGRTEEARKVLDAVLNQFPGLDGAYDLLIQIDGAEALPKLDAVYARDRFEERPLIWKAAILRNQKKLDEAEAAARAAIAIDPSDGEQPRGDRMRVYAVLADILADKGNAEQAQFFRGVVRAIRMSEDADQLHARFLQKRAIDLYDEALKYFVDAYCVQSRLAIQLAEMGYDKLAEEHYQKAFELMPSSFGRVESHCFGCEGAFKSPQAQSVAERVFTRFVATNPDKPQVHYLLGYLRQSQGKYADALDAFRTAVKLDPDYLNAWKHIIECSARGKLPHAERDVAALAIVRLDPQGRHGSVSISEIRDMEGLWNTAARVGNPGENIAKSLLVLSASSKQRGNSALAPAIDVLNSARNPLYPPSKAVSSTASVRALRRLMLQG